MIQEENLTDTNFKNTLSDLMDESETYQARMREKRPFKTAGEMYTLLTDVMKKKK